MNERQHAKGFPTVTEGEDIGRISAIHLAEEMAYEEKRILEDDALRAEIEAEEPDEYSVTIEQVAEDASDEIHTAYVNRLQRKLARDAFAKNRTWSDVNRPTSAGLPTLGKRK